MLLFPFGCAIMISMFKTEDFISINIDKWRAVVEENGGIWLGVQQSFADDQFNPMIVFRAVDSTTVHGVSINEFSEEKVRAKLHPLSEPKVDKHQKLVSLMQRVAQELRNLAIDIEEEIK